MAFSPNLGPRGVRDFCYLAYWNGGPGTMKRKRYTEEQIALALRQAESGTAVAEIVRKIGTEIA